MREKSKQFSPSDIEGKWYTYWMEKGYFGSVPDEREPFTIVIPPPNVTGVLHMGHMLNVTIQDILIRRARQTGKNACWVPGTDHASIATEAKVVNWLREEKGLKKSDISRKEFLKYGWQWKEKYGGIILEQLKKLGASCDWERTAFTMDEERSKAVFKSFVDLYNQGFLYRDYRMVNWDTEAKTVLSNEEVIYSEEDSQLYYVEYAIKGSEEKITIATTRPETILGDTAICVHPTDRRYLSLHGKEAIVPIVNRAVPIIADEYVDMEFGTGALKITPAHDTNDHTLGLKHNLEVIDILNEDGTLSDLAGHFIGLDRFVARKEVVKTLKEGGQLSKSESYRHTVGRSERTQSVIEPRLSLQWYVRMKDLAKPALKAVENNDILFFPENQKNTYRHWMANIKDWCISRQLWWGQRIPAYYYNDKVFVALDINEACEQARAHFNNSMIQVDDLVQDEDVLDTWFSSWLWPMSVFDQPEEQAYYYPTSVLVTGWDIIFLWVARMIISGIHWKDKKPFDQVYFTGMVRDKQRRKMSKSLGNSPDALNLINEYGADGVRFGMMSCSPAGGDLLFDEKLCEQGRKFSNKIWNGLNLLLSRTVSNKLEATEKDQLAYDWFLNHFYSKLLVINKQYEEFRLSESLIEIYKLIWNDFFSIYLEMIKPDAEKAFSEKTFNQAKELFELLLCLLHPYMPFITEEVWHQLEERSIGDDIIVSTYPTERAYDSDLLELVNLSISITSKVREIRNRTGLKWNAPVHISIAPSTYINEALAKPGWKELLMKTTVAESVELGQDNNAELKSFVIGTEKIFVNLGLAIDPDVEIEKLKIDLAYQEGFVNSIEKKLSNENFVNNAPEHVINNERKKLADGQERIKHIKESLKIFNN